MIHVLYGRHGSVTGKELDQALQDAGYTGKLINWGRGDLSELHTRPESVLNRPEAVKLASNKKKALKALKMAGIPVLLTEFATVYPRDLPVVGRKNYHTQGAGFYICRTMPEVKAAREAGCTHFQHYLEDCREFRVHVINNKVFRISERYGHKYVEDHTHSGGKFRYPKEFDLLPEVRRYAKESVQAMGLDFGAVDMLYDNNNGQLYVLEVNSAPSLSTCWAHLLPVYVRAFKTEVPSLDSNALVDAASRAGR